IVGPQKRAEGQRYRLMTYVVQQPVDDGVLLYNTLTWMHFFKATDGKYYGKVVEMFRPEDKNKTIKHGAHKGKPVVGFVVSAVLSIRMVCW
ncbi:MAG: hypothetical protein IIT93_04405, partial [Paludibacteraceae bacterium]|nr:hypothetical protein [Paludibacteraceae bacterium]